ncbi:MAG: histidine--tRNA ligase [Chloroflexi bacterium]|nr:histidine--tRNA ligase [Chloroflexota bacterium]
MKNIIQPLKGTRDFYPQQMAVRNWLYGKIRKISEAFGYQEYDGPFLESINLYAAKSGEELVKEQSYVFPDHSGDLITLRPELTPTLARMVAQKQAQLTFPLRWWSFGPFWRYERPQKGRSREFFQWNIDIIGIDSPQADAELITIIASFFKEIGLLSQHARVMVNSRKLIDAELAALEISPEKRIGLFKIIDRRSKLSPAEWEAYLLDFGLSASQYKSLISILNNTSLWEKSPELVTVFSTLKAFGVEDYVQFDPNIVRGLDYYTGIVFEGQEIQGEFRRAILGGGRYDNLLADVGGQPLPATGFAMGDMVISLILEKYGCLPVNIGENPAPVFITIFDENSRSTSYSLAMQLRQNGINVTCNLETEKLSKQLKYADRLGARIALIVGPDEQNNHTVTIKELKAGIQQTINQSELLSTIRSILEKPLT